MSAMKKRLLTALDRDPDLLYSVYLALLDRKFCGPWVPLKDFLGQPTDRMVREDHLGEVCAWVKQPTNPNSFGPDGQYDWSASFLPTDEIEDDQDPATTGTNGLEEDINDAMHAADEALRGAGWVLVPKADWQSPSGDEGVVSDPPTTHKAMDALRAADERDKMATDPFDMLKGMFKGKGER